MRQLLSFALVLISTSAFAQTNSSQTAIIDQENAFWSAYVQGNTDALSKLLLPDFTNVEQEIWSRDQVVSFVRKFHLHCTLAPVQILGARVKFITEDIATIVYHAIESPTCGTHSISGNTNISSVWVRNDGQWKLQLHTEYAIPSSTN